MEEANHMKKLRISNPFFISPVKIILINYLILLSSYIIQNNSNSLGYWNTAILLSEISLFIIPCILIVRVVFLIIKKITIAEFLIGFFLNLVALFFCYVVIFDRI